MGRSDKGQFDLFAPVPSSVGHDAPKSAPATGLRQFVVRRYARRGPDGRVTLVDEHVRTAKPTSKPAGARTYVPGANEAHREALTGAGFAWDEHLGAWWREGEASTGLHGVTAVTVPGEHVRTGRVAEYLRRGAGGR